MNADFERSLNPQTEETFFDPSHTGSRQNLAVTTEVNGMDDHVRKGNIVLREEIDKTSMFEEILTVSPSMKTVLSLFGKVAPTDSTVGETRGCRQKEEL